MDQHVLFGEPNALQILCAQLPVVLRAFHGLINGGHSAGDQALPPKIRIEAQHESDNPASGRVMEKAGMIHEGRLRQRVYNKGRYADVELYAILRQDLRFSAR